MANEAKRALIKVKIDLNKRISEKRDRKADLQVKRLELQVRIEELVTERDDIQNVIDTYLGGE